MKQKIDIKDLDINQAPICYLVETDEPWGYIVAKGTLRELETASIGTQWAHIFSGTFGIDMEDPELWPEDFDYVIVIGENHDIYNYDCDTYGVYCKTISPEEEGEATDIMETLGYLLHIGEAHLVQLEHDATLALKVYIVPERVYLQERYQETEHQCNGLTVLNRKMGKTLEIINNGNGWLSIFHTSNR